MAPWRVTAKVKSYEDWRLKSSLLNRMPTTLRRRCSGDCAVLVWDIQANWTTVLVRHP